MTITVYTKPNCPQCDMTKRALAQRGIAFESIDISMDPSAVASLQAKGFKQVPVVETSNASWCGFRPDMLAKLGT